MLLRLPSSPPIAPFLTGWRSKCSNSIFCVRTNLLKKPIPFQLQPSWMNEAEGNNCLSYVRQWALLLSYTGRKSCWNCKGCFFFFLFEMLSGGIVDYVIEELLKMSCLGCFKISSMMSLETLILSFKKAIPYANYFPQLCIQLNVSFEIQILCTGTRFE